MLWAALAFAGGIALSRYAWRPPLWWMAALAGSVAGALVFAKRVRRISLPCALIAVSALGAVAGAVRTAVALPPELAQFDGARVLITGHVIRDDSPKLAGLHQRR